jgi:UDP-N-acetylmuramyl pentapeptide phosphotransferase/UDP-N-acetylglucosamine-1-phosphate transferase
MYSILLSFITAFLLTFRVIPSIIHIAKKKKLYDIPDERKAHQDVVPRLGGIAIFAGLLFSIILWCPFQFLGDIQYILAAFIIVFLIGAKDDIEPTNAMKKLIGEIFAAMIIVFFANIRITSFYGLFGIGYLPYIASVIFTIFVIIALINAFNLIDGVNGLAGSIGILVGIVFGFWFYKIERIELAVVSFAYIGAIVAFLYYNISPAKIFMGDSGSLLLGLVSSVLAIGFLESNSEITYSRYFIGSGPVFAMAILVIPIFDTLRVLILRIFSGKSPFSPDMNHIHHMLLNFGLRHMEVTALLMGGNIFFVVLAYFLSYLNINLLFLILIIIVLIITQLLSFLHNNHLKSIQKIIQKNRI